MGSPLLNCCMLPVSPDTYDFFAYFFGPTAAKGV
jgi:hypothetical protein